MHRVHLKPAATAGAAAGFVFGLGVEVSGYENTALAIILFAIGFALLLYRLLLWWADRRESRRSPPAEPPPFPPIERMPRIGPQLRRLLGPSGQFPTPDDPNEDR